MFSKDFCIVVEALHRLSNDDTVSKKHIPSAISELVVYFFMGKIDKNIQNSIEILNTRLLKMVVKINDVAKQYMGEYDKAFNTSTIRKK